jgi:CelD/BcsL family acetyltransferase involved in cellulose biosynthesis
MRIQEIRGSDLTEELARCWARIQHANPDLSSPFFSPQYIQAVVGVRDDVQIAVMEHDNKVVGFFPFHRNRLGVARAAGLGLSDFHGAIVESGISWSASELFSQCRLVRWKFDHLAAAQSGFESAVSEHHPSPIIRLDQGFDGYIQALNARGRKQFKEVHRKQLKLEADHGDIRFVEHTSSDEILQIVMQWKSLQCRQAGLTDYFSFAWTRALLRDLHETQDSEFQGVLSCLYVGDRVAAVHFGMRTQRVWHYWFPAYSYELSAYSPGLILLYEIIRSAATSGRCYIDLGTGSATYKDRVMNDQILVGAGCVECPSLVNQLISCAESMERWNRDSFMQPLWTVPARVVRRVARCHRYR